MSTLSGGYLSTITYQNIPAGKYADMFFDTQYSQWVVIATGSL